MRSSAGAEIAAGADEPAVLVCLHGLAASSRWWDGIVGDLEDVGPVQLLDLPRRTPPHELGRWVEGRLDAVGAPVDLMGHSLGALVALRVAAARPDLVRKLILIAPPGMPPLRSPLGYGLPLVASLARSRPRFLLRLAKDALRAGPANIIRRGTHVAHADARSDAEQVQAPTLIVWGARDCLFPSASAGLWLDAVADAELHVIDSASHVPMIEAPAELLVAIGAFRRKG